ncbi:hypothetical protein ACLB2K_020488 [Fragaria x ananassa]
MCSSFLRLGKVIVGLVHPRTLSQTGTVIRLFPPTPLGCSSRVSIASAAHVQDLAAFLIRHHSHQLRSIALSPDPKLHYPCNLHFLSLILNLTQFSLSNLSFAELIDDDPRIAQLVFSQPTEYLRLLDDAALWAHRVVLGDLQGLGKGVKKEFIHVRIDVSGSPLECLETFPSIGRVRVKHRGILLTLKGTMIRSGAIKMYEGERKYMCQKCKHEFLVYPEMESRNSIRLPSYCPSQAGLVTTLSTKTIVFGATNPKGQYDPDQSLSVNTALSGPLLSRFDIVLVLLDTKNPEWDGVVSSHILSEGEPDKGKNDENLADIWPFPMLRRYIHYVKGYIKPVLTKEAEIVISSYYQLQRRSATDNAARTTVRMLESLIRLAQAHARLMFRNEVTRLDAITAILCIESSMTTSAIVDSLGNALHSNFTENPDMEYAKQEKLILEKLSSFDKF